MRDLEHPEIGWIERTGYPSWMQDGEPEDLEDRENCDNEFWGDGREDDLFEERRDRERFCD